MRLASGTINTNQDIPHGHISIMCGFLLCLLNTVKNCKYGPVFIVLVKVGWRTERSIVKVHHNVFV